MRWSSSDLGDVNGDGHLDLVLTGDNARFRRRTTLYLGDGAGGFTKAEAGLTGVSRGSSSFGDVNDDGHLDLVITGEGYDIEQTSRGKRFSPVSVAALYLGDGEGGFTEVDAGLDPVDWSSSAFGHVDGDRHLDLVVTGFGPNGPSTTVYLGNGQGEFSKAHAGLTGVAEGFVSLGDINNDGQIDLLVSGKVASDKERGPGTQKTILYLNEGNGRFSEAPLDLPDVNRGSASFGDVNEDGTLDFILLGEDPYGTERTVLYLGDGSGNFKKAKAELPGIRAGAASFGDVNGNGHLDLVVVGKGRWEFPTARLFLGDGNGGFALAETGMAAVEHRYSSFGDLNNERNLEANAGLTGVLAGTSVALGDVNEDNNLDVVLTGDEGGYASPGSPFPQKPTARLYLGDGQGSFRATHITGVRDGSSALGDVNGDGALDLVLTGLDPNNRPSARVYLGDNQGCFTAANAGLIGHVHGPTTSLEDVNSDGDLDLLLTGSSNTFRTNRVAVQQGQTWPNAELYLGDGSGDFTKTGAGLAGASYGSSSFGDVNGDGNLDLVTTGLAPTASREPTTTLYYGDGQGGFTKAQAGLVGVAYGSSSLVDLNADDALDLVLTGGRKYPTGRGRDPTAVVYRGNGTGEFRRVDAGLTGVVESGSAVGDVNEDDHPDLVIMGEDANYLPNTSLYLGDGTGRFDQADAGLVDVSGGGTEFADVTANDHLDLLIAGVDSPNDTLRAKLYLGKGNGDFTESGAGLPLTGNETFSVGDLNNDGYLDLIISGAIEGSVTTNVYLGTGQGTFRMIER